ncbi:hypothetical protein B0J13DRAFT_679604 [Dactylonectria estremocensis]|uniref:Arb2 domain-containing protein n=1 Tax=Dactylonectria estremocensis TaxID=1079267 RepID=A0A9P9IP73_9HYPO|nr:hypothetical protein B0J13DRAFT_679604 [Dactylonectria estremocensis]
MFRRHWSGLPKDASFPSDLAGLGYFVNEDDEIRSIENPTCYYKFFHSRNARVNERQRFAFNGALEKIVHERLEKQGLVKMTLPLDASPSQNHTPIFATTDLASCSRIVVIFGEPTHDLGVLAGRVANGPGGLVKGSMNSFIPVLHQQAASPVDASPPGIVLANMGQRYWWPEGKRALTIEGSGDTPLPSLVHSGTRHVSPLNDIPGSESAIRHMETIFRDIVTSKTTSTSKIDVVAIGPSCEVVENFFDDQKTWGSWGGRLNSMVLFGTVFDTVRLTNEGFKRFLAERTRAYLISEEPLDTPLAPPQGNASLMIDPLGCPCYSSSELHYTELIAIRALRPAFGYLQEVAMTPGFINPPIEVMERPQTEFTEQDWQDLPDDGRPFLTRVDPEDMKKKVAEAKRWRSFEQTGEAPNSDYEDDEDDDEWDQPQRGNKSGGGEDNTWKWKGD